MQRDGISGGQRQRKNDPCWSAIDGLGNATDNRPTIVAGSAS